MLQLTAGGHVLPAKLVDVSRSGMQVVAPVLLHVGDEVCASLPATLPTPGAAGRVRGRVCWTAPARADGTPQTRAGVAFELPLTEAEALPPVVEEQAGRAVIVQFSGAMPQVMARALASDTGMCLRFSLPCMREGALITLHSQDDDPKEMRVVGARLDSAGEQVELLVEPCPETRKRRFLQYDEAAPARSDLPAELTEAPREVVEVQRAPKRRVLAGVGIGASLMAALWIAGRVSQPESEPASEVATQALTHSDLERPAVPELVSQPDRRAAPARHTIAAGSSGRPQPVATAAQPRASADPSAAIASTPAKTAAPETAEPSGPKSNDAPAPASQTNAPTPAASKPLAAATPEQPRPAGLSVSTTKDTTEIFVPVSGSLAGLATKIWTDPAAVVVEIPRGQVGLTQRKYDIQKDGVVGISVGKPGGVAQIRVYVNSILSQYNATAVPGGVSIRIKRDLQSLP